MQIAKPERRVRSPFGQCRKPQIIMNEWPNDARDFPPTWWLFYLVREPGPGESEGWVTGGLIKNWVTLKSLPFKETTMSLSEAIYSTFGKERSHFA